MTLPGSHHEAHGDVDGDGASGYDRGVGGVESSYPGSTAGGWETANGRPIAIISTSNISVRRYRICSIYIIYYIEYIQYIIAITSTSNISVRRYRIYSRKWQAWGARTMEIGCALLKIARIQ